MSLSPEAVAPGLMTYAVVLIGVLVVIFVVIAYLTSTTHTRKLSHVE